MSLKGKVVIVTGGGSGIGAATAIEFVKQGANVAIVGRTENNLKITAEKCSTIDNEVLIINADIRKEDDAKRIIQTTIDKFGKLDVLINNAGLIKTGSICEGDILGAYDAVINTNLRGAIHLTTLATPYLTKTKGNVINISSVVTFIIVGLEYFTYSIAKAGLNYFTKCAAVELADRGIRVNSVSPGPVETDILVKADLNYGWEELARETALNRVSQPQEIADLVTFLASNKAKGITGSNYLADNGMALKRSKIL